MLPDNTTSTTTPLNVLTLAITHEKPLDFLDVDGVQQTETSKNLIG
jgi:hypothetical protein